MCGITGWFNRQVQTADKPDTLQAMMSTIKHRGPDGQGKFFSQHVALGHVRLSIIDLNTGQQPMLSHDKTACISFNGEIYNYQELRRSLQAEGYPFNTHSDTEVIIALYQTMGIQGFSLLRGMYAFALWDKKTRSAYLVRDPSGIKPLFIAGDHQQLLFGSEAKAILAHPGYHSELDPNSLHSLMNFRYLPGNQSLFKGITQLEPGRILHWHAESGIKDIPFSTEANAGHNIIDAFEDSVHAHFTADVEVGCYLSGGIDSAAICAMGKNLSHEYQLQSFTLDAGDDPLEADNAQRSAAQLGIINHRQAIEFNPLQCLPEMLWHLEVPKINSLQIKLLAQVAAKKVKVCLSGLGGDEAFYGYNVHRFMHQANKLSKVLPGLTHRWAGAIGKQLLTHLSQLPFSETSRKFSIVQSLGQWSKVYGLMRNIWDNPKLRQKIYGPRMLDSDLTDCYQQLENLWPGNDDPVTALAQFENQHKLVNDLLWQEDRMSMACGLEVRVPFVDQPFLKTVHRFNRQQLMPHGRTKSLMKELFRPLLGDEIIQRPKSGFQVSSPHFFHQHLSVMAKQWLTPERITAYGLFNPEFVNKILQLKPAKKLRWHYFILYLMLLTHVWIEIFENKTDYKQFECAA